MRLKQFQKMYSTLPIGSSLPLVLYTFEMVWANRNDRYKLCIILILHMCNPQKNND